MDCFQRAGAGRPLGTGNRNDGCRTSKSLPLWGRWRAAPDEVPSRCASRLCSNKRRTSDKDLIRLSAKTQAFSPKSTFPRKAEILRGFPVSPLAKLILTNQRFGKITGEGFWLLRFTPINQNLLPAPVQPSPASVPAGARRRTRRYTGIRRTGRRTRCRTGVRRARAGRAAAVAGGAAIPLHADHQVPAFIHAQQHLGALPGAAGVFNRHPAARAFVRQPSCPAARAAEHGHAHAGVPIAVISHTGI